MIENAQLQGVVGIIGGGAAGMMAAATLKESGFQGRVLLFEKNSYLGAKVIISGGGRCNVTTGIFDVQKLLENYPRGAKFLMSAMFRFPPEQVMEWFEAQDVRLKIEKDLRVFPKSNNGKDIVGALEKRLQRLGVQIFCNAAVTDVRAVADVQKVELQKNAEKVRDQNEKAHNNKEYRRGVAQNDELDLTNIVQNNKEDSEKNKQKSSIAKNGGFILTLKDGRTFKTDKLILTTGGTAYRHTGSTGDGYAFAMNLGHSITPLAPSLHSFILSEPWTSQLAGVSFSQVGLTLQGKQIYTRLGPIVFTHKGISGPAVFAISSMSAYEVFNQQNPLKLFLNFFPQEIAEELRKRFNTLLIHHGKKQLINFIDIFLPKSLCSIFVERLGIDPTVFVNKIGRKGHEAIVSSLQRFECTVVGRGAGDEFVTAGGVNLDEVNTNTMESKICPGLYFGGEILDVDGFTGGFNLQASWATGHLAGESIATAQ